MENDGSRDIPFLSPQRLEAITDSIFAVGMTLLVLGVEVPALPRGASDAELAEALWNLGFPLFKYVVSFLLLGTFWATNIGQIRHIRRVDATFLWFGMGSLLLVALVPFSTSLVGDFPDRTPAELFFHANIFGICALHALQWVHATKGHRLVDPALPEEIVDRARRLNLLAPTFAVIGMAISPLEIFESNFIYILIPFLAALRRRIS